MTVEFAGSYSTKSITLSYSKHYIDEYDEETKTVIVASDPTAVYEISDTTPGDNYQTLSNVVDNAYPSPVKDVSDLSQVYHNYYVNGQRLQHNKTDKIDGIIETTSIQNNKILVDYVPPSINRVEYVNDSQDTVMIIYTDDHPRYHDSATKQTGESNYYRTYTLVIDSSNHPEDTDPDVLVQVHTLYGHLNHPLNESINYRNHYDIVSATLLDQIFNTHDTEVTGGCIINSDLSRYYLGNRIVLPEGSILKVSPYVLDETSTETFDTINLNIGAYNIQDNYPVNSGDSVSMLKLDTDGYDFASPQRGYLFPFDAGSYVIDEEIYTNSVSGTETRYYYFQSSYLGTSTQTSTDNNYAPFPPNTEVDANGTVYDDNYIMGTGREDENKINLVKISAAYSSEIPESDTANYRYTDYFDLILYTGEDQMHLFPEIPVE